MPMMSKERAAFQVKSFQSRIGELTYDEALILYTEACQFAEDCGPFDPAFEYFVRQRDTMVGYMNALNVVKDLQRVDHLDFYNVMISGKKSMEIDTLEVGVPKHLHRIGVSKEHFINTVVKSYAKHLMLRGFTKLMTMEDIDEIVEVNR